MRSPRSHPSPVSAWGTFTACFTNLRSYFYACFTDVSIFFFASILQDVLKFQLVFLNLTNKILELKLVNIFPIITTLQDLAIQFSIFHLYRSYHPHLPHHLISHLVTSFVLMSIARRWHTTLQYAAIICSYFNGCFVRAQPCPSTSQACYSALHSISQ